MKTSTVNSKMQNTNETNRLSSNQIKWAREQILHKYRETNPDLMSFVEASLQSLTL